MKKYNVKNYIRYKEDVKQCQPYKGKRWDEYSRDELIVKFLPLVENISRKFATSQQASGVMSIMDIIQEGSFSLIKAVDKLTIKTVLDSEDPEKTIKSFFSKRIKGGIRRKIDENRANMRIPEHKINEIRKDGGKNKRLVEMFFNSIFVPLDGDSMRKEDKKYIDDIPDTSTPNNSQILNAYIISLMKKYLDYKEFEVLRMSYGLDCEKHSAVQIAKELNIVGVSNYVRVSELKKQAIEKLIENVDHSQVVEYL